MDTPGKEKILQENPGIDERILAEYEHFQAVLRDLGAQEKPSSYTLDRPFSQNQNAQPIFSSLQNLQK